jgi:DNA polymerase elongation subunit (family B)
MSINIKNMTTEEIENFDWSSLSPLETKHAVRQLNDEANIYKTLEQANKLVLNSIYGSMANRFFYFYDKSLAETVTIQGQDAIKYAEKALDSYFHNTFHKDKALLVKLKEICSDVILEPSPCKRPMVVYMDTDSAYVTFEEVAEKINWTGSVTDLVLTINEFRLSDYLNKVFDKYAKSYNTDNYLEFELETISKTGIWAKKKKYTQDIVWEDGKFFDSGSYIKTTGLEIIRLTTPPFCRPELIKLVSWIFDKGNDFTERDITIELLKLKKRFAIADIEDISITTGIGDYEKYILNDKDSLQVASGCGTHVRGAAIFNLYINNNSQFATKYEKITTGDKVKWYYCKSHKKEFNTFSFKRGSYPKEFAPEVDIDLMFEKTVVNPLNNILRSMKGITELSGSLKIKKKLF